MTQYTIHNDEATLNDKLLRSELRREFGLAISNCTPPHVFGLHGEWGSGKTSFLRQLRYELDNANDTETCEGPTSPRFQ